VSTPDTDTVAELRATLREKEVLLKEIHHRVKNNLQVTSSLLRLQSAHIKDPVARELFVESQHRIHSMALVHEKLYQAPDLARVDMRDYTDSLAQLLARAYGTDGARIKIKLAHERLFLGIDIAVPVGLVLNELISNCLKHAFADGRDGRIEITIDHHAGQGFTVAVADDGVGLPADLDVRRAHTLGLQLVHTLAEQLRGTIVVTRRARGTIFTLEVPL
jgi:two-component sensor histidine kinase